MNSPEEKARLESQMKRAVSTRNLMELAQGWVRYEKLRILNPHQYAELCRKNINGEGRFDDLVDGLEGPV